MGSRIQPRGRVNRTNTLVLEKFADPEDVIGVADSDATAQLVGAHNYGHALRRFRGVAALHFCDQAAFRHSPMHKIIAANATLAVMGVGSGTPGSDDYRGDATLVKSECMIKPGTPDRGRAAGVLGRAKDHNRVRGLDFLLPGRFNDLDGSGNHNKEH